MAYEVALATVNNLQDQLAGLARAIVHALDDDGKVSALEGMQFGMQGMALASAVILALQVGNRAEILYVLEHGDWALKEGTL